MILLGAPVMGTKGVISDRRAGWLFHLMDEIAHRLDQKPHSDEELIGALISRQRLEPIQLTEARWPDHDFQIAYQAFYGLTPFFSFTREIHYTGSRILWRQKPYKGFSTKVRLKRGADGDVFFYGYCTENEQELVERYLTYEKRNLQAAFDHIRPLVDKYNSDLEIMVETFVMRNRKQIEELRATRAGT